MKKAILSITLALLVFASCNLPNEKPESYYSEQPVKEDVQNKIEVIVYDGCEYLFYKEDKDNNSSYGFMAHKGNCSNPIHLAQRTE